MFSLCNEQCRSIYYRLLNVVSFGEVRGHRNSLPSFVFLYLILPGLEFYLAAWWRIW